MRMPDDEEADRDLDRRLIRRAVHQGALADGEGARTEGVQLDVLTGACACATEKQAVMEIAAIPASALSNMRSSRSWSHCLARAANGPSAYHVLAIINARAVSGVNWKRPRGRGGVPDMRRATTVR